MQMGMQTPMSPKTLTLARFYSLVWAFDNHHHDIELLVPDYRALSKALATLRGTYEYRRQSRRSRDCRLSTRPRTCTGSTYPWLQTRMMTP
jgi:hypothetical protein